MNIAYLCNSLPEPSESYVVDEIRELERNGVAVVPCSVWRRSKSRDAGLSSETLTLFPLRFPTCIVATWLCVRKFSRIRDLVWRAARGPEPPSRRLRTLAHTWLGAYFATSVRSVHPDHIHVHHGYFASWTGMVAARLLGIEFSLTLHGSDLLVRADYLDVKLHNCRFCFTISEFNRRHILEHFSGIDVDKILVQHLGVDPHSWRPLEFAETHHTFHILTVGRLHSVKNQAFLLLACRALKSAGISLRCTIAGEGPEQRKLERLIVHLDLQNEVQLLGEVSSKNLPELYADADVVVLTSHSEGIPLTLMEAMAMERVVLAPDITGIPELVSHGKTGFLYRPGSMEEFLIHLQIVLHGGQLLNKMRRAARLHVLRRFNSHTNLAHFSRTFFSRVHVERERESILLQPQAHENPLLQQI